MTCFMERAFQKFVYAQGCMSFSLQNVFNYWTKVYFYIGLTHMVYPEVVHSRVDHSLGVY